MSRRGDVQRAKFSESQFLCDGQRPRAVVKLRLPPTQRKLPRIHPIDPRELAADAHAAGFVAIKDDRFPAQLDDCPAVAARLAPEEWPQVTQHARFHAVM